MDGITSERRSVQARPGDGSVSEAVVTAVAAANGVDPLDLDTLLHDVVDPDALERLFPVTQNVTASHTVGQVTFRMADCQVVVEQTGRVTATPLTVDEPVVTTD